MFWKKQKPMIEPGHTDDQRETFRYTFKGDPPLSLTFKQKPVKVLNISAGGMAFINQGFAPYEEDQITLFLDIPHFMGESVLTARLRILNITANNICHCIFENCTLRDYEMIHKYVLEMQKKELTTQYQTR